MDIYTYFIHSVLVYLLEWSKVSKTKILLNTIRSKEERGGEVFSFGNIAGNIGALNNTLLSAHCLDEGVGESSRSIGHRKSSRASTSLSLHNLGTSILKQEVSKLINYEYFQLQIIFWIIFLSRGTNSNAK